MTDEICYTCGSTMKEFDIVDPEIGKTVATEIFCPNEWKESHKRGAELV